MDGAPLKIIKLILESDVSVFLIFFTELVVEVVDGVNLSIEEDVVLETLNVPA